MFGTGEREAVSKAQKELYYDLHTLVVEERPDDSVILRRTLRSESLPTIRAASLSLIQDTQEASDLIAEADSAADLAEGVSKHEHSHLCHKSNSESH